jgi:hypothetical protein
MKFLIPTFLMLGLLLSSCSAPVEVEEEDTSEEVAEIVLATEELNLEKVTFVSEDSTYLYSFAYDKAMFRYLGYYIDGMSENGGSFILTDGSEITTSTSSNMASGIEKEVGEFLVLKSTDKEGDCTLEYRVVDQEGENLVLRAKSCEGQNPDSASKALDDLLYGLAIDEL